MYLFKRIIRLCPIVSISLKKIIEHGKHLIQTKQIKSETNMYSTKRAKMLKCLFI